MPRAAKTAASQLACGSDILVQSLINHGVDVIFAYPGGASMPLHQSLTKFKDQIRTVLPRHEQGGAFAAQGYARSTGKPGVCMATSGPAPPTWSPPLPTPSSIASPWWPSPGK